MRFSMALIIVRIIDHYRYVLKIQIKFLLSQLPKPKNRYSEATCVCLPEWGPGFSLWFSTQLRNACPPVKKHLCPANLYRYSKKTSYKPLFSFLSRQKVVSPTIFHLFFLSFAYLKKGLTSDNVDNQRFKCPVEW